MYIWIWAWTSRQSRRGLHASRAGWRWRRAPQSGMSSGFSVSLLLPSINCWLQLCVMLCGHFFQLCATLKPATKTSFLSCQRWEFHLISSCVALLVPIQMESLLTSPVKPAPAHSSLHHTRLAMAPSLHNNNNLPWLLKGPRDFSVTKQEIVRRLTNLLFITWSRRAGGVM